MSDSVVTHNFMLYLFLGVMFFNIYSVYTVKSFIPLAKRLKFTTPLYHTMNAMIIYTGAIVSAYNRVMSITVILMIATAIFLMVAEIKRYKKMRVIKSTDVALQEAFVVYAKKIYTIEISVLIVVYIICKVF